MSRSPQPRRLSFGFAMLAAAAVALPGFAGSHGYNKCPEDTQTCLNHMVAKLKGQGWLGIWLDDSHAPKQLTVTRVVGGSPAEAAGFKVGDLLVSVNGAKFARNTEKKCVTCEAIKDIWKPGKRVDYVVRRKNKNVVLHPTLAALPSDAMAQMIGMHMLDHVQTEDASKEDRTSKK